MATNSPELKLQLDIPVVLPGVDDARDGCVSRLQERLRGQTGITLAHLEKRDGKDVLCLHYDANLVTLEKLERLAREEGAAVTGRFKHEHLPIRGMDCASCAASIEAIVRKMNGVLGVAVNYPTQKMKIEYDSSLTSRGQIIKVVGKLGYRVPTGASRRNAAPVPPSHPDEHDSENYPHADAEPDAHSHADHEPGAEPHDAHSHASDSANWLTRNSELAQSLACGALLLVGWLGERLGHWPFAAALPIYLLSYVAGGYNLARHTLPSLWHGRFNVDFLMLAGAAGAAFLAQWAEGAFLLFLFSLGHSLEHLAMDRARDAIGALGKLTPKVALVRRDGQEIEVPLEAIRVGDAAIIRPGDRVAVEGTIVRGASSLDQSPITGESVPIEKGVGDAVFAGSINGEGALEVEVTRLAGDTTLARVLVMVEEAQSQKSPTQTFAENFERIFVPGVLGVVVLAALVPPLAGWLSWKVALLRAISTLVAASPCALALATPAAVLAGIAQAARGGVLIKGGVHLENLGALRAMAFDKTGTLTRGRPELTDICVAPDVSAGELLQLAASVETRSSHPLAQAVVRRAQIENLPLWDAGELQNLPGRGVQAVVAGHIVRLGNARMLEESQIPLGDELQSQLESLSATGKPTMIVARDAQVLGVLAFADELRAEVPAVLAALRAMGIEPLVMLSGDNARVAQTLARAAGVTEFRADLLPEDKVAALQTLMAQHGAVAMVGDGVNDAPALASATVGIAMGAGGTDVALETADVALMGDDLNRLPFAVALSREARAIIRQNLWIALGVIAVLVPSTLFGLARLGVAVVFHEGSTLVVVANALRLLNFQWKARSE